MARNDEESDRLKARLAAIQAARSVTPRGGVVQPDAKTTRAAGASTRSKSGPAEPLGRRPSTGLSLVPLVVLVVIVVLAIFYGWKGRQGDAASGGRPGRPLSAQDVGAIRAAERRVTGQLGHANSVRFSNEFVPDARTPVVCGYVTIGNAAGQFGPDWPYVVAGASVVVDNSSDPSFADTWNARCVSTQTASH